MKNENENSGRADSRRDSANSDSSKRSNSSIDKRMKDSDFHHLFLMELQDIYWAEQHLLKALPKMKKAANSEELANSITTHINDTKSHIDRLEKAFNLLEEKARARKCEAMAGLIKEGEELLEDMPEPSYVRDAGIIMCSQKIEHYEIASYGALVVWANKMEHSDVANLLSKNLENEKQTDVILSKIAVNYINEEALAE